MIKALKDDLPENLKLETDDLKIAQIHNDTFGHKHHIEKVRDVLKDGRVAYNPIHHAILALHPAHIITTNYDDLIEQAIRSEFRQYDVVSKDSDLPYYRYPNKLVKMHGDYAAGNIVLTEEDYYNYASNYPLIRSFITSLFTTNVVLFVGFSFNDINLKIILNELKNILDKDMQRVYLLADNSSIDASSESYYTQKGITILNIPSPDEYISELNIKAEDEECNKIGDIQGKVLYKQLQIIKYIESDFSANTLKIILSRLRSIQTELTVLDEGLKYLIPQSAYRYWSFYNNGLHLDSVFFNELANTLRTTQGKRSFVLDFPKKERDFLFQQALINRVYSIDSLEIITKNNHEKIQRGISEITPAFLFYDMKFGDLNQSLMTLRKRGLFYDKRDLFLPFILCRYGRFYEAYLIYEKLIPEFWEKGLYVLYFISIYNLQHIKGGIWNEVWNKPDIDVDSIIERIDGFDTEAILSKLPVGEIERKTLKDVLSNKYFSSYIIKADELSSKIHLQRKKAEKGSVSANDNIYGLISRFWRMFFFCIRNSIEYRNEYFEIILKDTIIGILNSHTTQKGSINGIFENTRIETLESGHVFILISFISTKDLSEILSQYEIKKIRLSDKAIAYFSELIDNIHVSMIGKYGAINLSFDSKYIIHVFCNIILLIDRTDMELSQETIAKVYDIVLREWNLIYNDNDVINALSRMVKKYHPDTAVAKRLLDKCIQTPHLVNKSLNFSLVNYLASVGFRLIEPLDDDYLMDDYGRNGFVLYKVMPTKTRAHYVSLLHQTIKDPYTYIHILKLIRVKVKSEVDFKKMLDGIRFTAKSKNDNKLAFVANLVRLRKDSRFSNIHSILDEFGEKHKEYLFLMNPTKYNIIEEIEPLWMLACTRKELKDLLKNEFLRKRMKDYISSDSGRLYFDSIFPLL